MDWSSLAFGLALAKREKEKEQKKKLEEINSHRSEISDGVFALQELLSELSFPQMTVLDIDDLNALEELAPLFPMSEILSMQGYIGEEQQLFLQHYINVHHPRYNLGQFITASVQREGIYPEWNDLAGLAQDHCGKIWHTLIELICRQRTPDTMQQVVDLLGKILYHFWFLECPDMGPAQICYRRIISILSLYADSDQKLPYLHAVMLLQMELAQSFGGEAADYLPLLEPDEKCDMDGTPGSVFFVTKEGDRSFIRFYTVRDRKAPGDPDLIWELPAGGADPIVFFSE